MEKYNVGILGVGFMGKTHAGSLSKLDNVTVVAASVFCSDFSSLKVSSCSSVFSS